MDSSRRAVESYWRSRMIDAATSDEDKVTPVYKLEEICELLRSSHVSIVKEVSEFILKRLEHKSPVVKQKALRLIKYAVGKSGTEFRREMQRHSVAVRQLFHYKGHVDPLKGDALNKSVRDTAHEVISAIFSEDNGKPAPAENLNQRIQGFGNTSYEISSEDKKSFITEVVGIGSASIKQGISSFTQGHSLRKNDFGSYKSPNLRRSLTIENEYGNMYEPSKHSTSTHGGNVSGGSWNQDLRLSKAETVDGDSGTSYTERKTREERLLETIVTSGGIRLQPTRDAIQVFLVEAAKLNALALSHALDSKLQSPMWQVRMKAVCVLESILRKKDDEQFSVVASYFNQNKDTVFRCSESPQASLREKANKVLSLLDGQVGDMNNSKMPVKVETATFVQLPDLIDTGDPDHEYKGADDLTNGEIDKKIAIPTEQRTPFIDDLFSKDSSAIKQKNDEDPFSDVSFHTSDVTKQEKQGSNKSVDDLMAGLSVHENDPKMRQKGTSGGIPETLFPDLSNDPQDTFIGIPQVTGISANFVHPSNTMGYNIPHGIMFNPNFQSQPINYGAMGNFINQQQLLATMSNLQHLGHLNSQNAGVDYVSGTKVVTSPLPDIFQPTFATQTTSPVYNSKKEETRAFDFISDHVASARDPKKGLNP